MSEHTIAKMNAMGWMHIYAQPFQHAEAEIRGTTEALTALRDALTRAIEEGVAEATAFADDGEGYEVKINRVNVLNLLGPLPYTDEPWVNVRDAAWSQPPEPFDPDVHRVIVRVGPNGQPLPGAGLGLAKDGD